MVTAGKNIKLFTIRRFSWASFRMVWWSWDWRVWQWTLQCQHALTVSYKPLYCHTDNYQMTQLGILLRYCIPSA